MKITHSISLDFRRYTTPSQIDVVQDDTYSRYVAVSLYDNAAEWPVPDGATIAVRFKKPDKTQGAYDTLPNGEVAYSIDGNVVTVGIAPQMLVAKGKVTASAVIYLGSVQLATFPFVLNVVENPAAGQSVSMDYYYLSTFAAVNEAIGDLNNLQTSTKESLVAAINELAQVTVLVDTTLTKEGYAADAKATGDAISNLSAEHTIDINELKYYQFGNRKTFIATLNDVDHIAKQYDFKFMKGCSYRLKFASTNPLPDDYFYLSFSLKDKDGNNIQTFIARDFHGYVTFKCEVDNALSFGYYLYLRKNTTADFSLTIEYVSVDERINDLQTTSFARPVILDTDFAWDVDDAFAIRAIAWGVLNGAIDLMCVNLSMVNSKSVSAMDGILCEEGIGDCVIGANKDVNGTLRTYHSILEQFPNHKFTKNGDAISDVEMYRKALASLPIGVKADIICIGRLTSIHRLLTSPLDWISPLSGMDLVTEKVNKLWLMGGNFNTGNSEANFTADKTATSYVLTNFPCEIMIQGSEIAEKNINMTSGRLTEGENLNTEISENDYIYRCLQSWLPESNMPVSMPYDPMLVISAIENDEYVSGIYYDRGTVVINEDGSTTFTESSSGNHFVTRKSFDNFYYQNKINSIMARKWVNSKMQKRFRLTRQLY